MSPETSDRTSEGLRPLQIAIGDGIAQAIEGSTAIVNITHVYQHAPPAPVNPDTLAHALARLAKLSVDEVPAPAALPAGSRMPLARNAAFVGRAADLKQLAALLKAGGTAAIGQIAAVGGLGGIGKTQLASEFVHRYGQYFMGGVFWLSLADPAAVPAEIAACGGAGALDLSADFSRHPLSEQVGRVAAAWSSALPRLLVFDNCEDEALLDQWRPRTGGCRVLVTSRRVTWSAGLGVQPLPLGVLARAESIELLRKHRPDLSAQDPTLDGIAEILGDLPLALHLAGAYLKRYEHSPRGLGDPAHYLGELQKPDLLAHRSLTVGDRSPTGHEQHVARTFALSYDRLDPADPTEALALALLACTAYFAPGEPIPRALLLATLGVADEEQAYRAEDALGRLVEVGLVTVEAEGALVLHRLLQAFVQSAMEADPRADAQAAVEAAVLVEAHRINQSGYPAPLLAWGPHLRHVAEVAAARDSEWAGRLMNELGYHLNMVGEYMAARVAYEKALAIEIRTFGDNSPGVALGLNNLCAVLLALNELDEARAAAERALQIDRGEHGFRHPSVAQDLNTLGSILRALKDLPGACRAFKRALAIGRKVLGSKDPVVATYLNNLGGAMQESGDVEGACTAFERALNIDKEFYGYEHSSVARDLNNLGLVLKNLKDLSGAGLAFEQSLDIAEKVFGSGHPYVATVSNNLAGILWDCGDTVSARTHYERALRILVKRLGEDHPRTQVVQKNLALLNEQAAQE